MKVWIIQEITDNYYFVTYIKKVFDSEKKAIEYLKILKFDPQMYVITEMDVE